MIEVYTGIPGAGKSTYMAKTAIWLFKRNEKFYKSSGKLRKVCSNMRFSEEVEKRWGYMIKYWNDLDQIIYENDIDVLWDEIARVLDATNWAELSIDAKAFLQQHRKRGIDIYGTTQELNLVDISMRRIVNRVYWLSKLVGSRDISATKPEVKVVWGLIMKRLVDPKTYAKEDERKFIGFSFFVLSKKWTKIFDTRQIIEAGKYPSLKHIVRYCNDPLHPECNYSRVTHK